MLSNLTLQGLVNFCLTLKVPCVLLREIYWPSLANKKVISPDITVKKTDSHALMIGQAFTLNLLIECFRVSSVSTGPLHFAFLKNLSQRLVRTCGNLLILKELP